MNTPGQPNLSPSPEEVGQRIHQILVREVPGAEGAAFDTPLALLGVDSLAAIEIAFEVESAFGISMANDEVSAKTTTGDLVRLVVGKLGCA